MSFQNGVDIEKKGFVNLAYEYGSQNELCLPATTASTVTFSLPGLGPQNQVQEVHSRLSGLNGVLAASWASSGGLVKVDYDASVITTEEIFLELRTAGLDVESAVRIGVDGMHCRSCVQSIEGRIASLSGVLKVQVSLEDAAALIVHRPLLVTRQELRDHIQDLGFEATLLADDPAGADVFWRQEDASSVTTQTVTVWIVGMTCHSCVQSIEGRVSQMRGVQTVMVSLKEEKGTVTFDPSLTAPEQLRAAIEDMGFDASLEGESL